MVSKYNKLKIGPNQVNKEIILEMIVFH